MKTYFRTPLLAVALAAAACASDEPREEAAPAEAPPAAGAGMPGMEGMHGMQNGGTMQQMQAHMRTMHGASGDSLRSMLPMHRQMAANMIAEFNREMRGMNMSGDAAWNATVDSLRQDLTRMPEMAPAELQSFMPAHDARLTRLMEMHRAMMADMQM